MFTNFYTVIIFFLQLIICFTQRNAYNETCNSTDECSDHRYICQLDQENVSRCLCDRFHVWVETIGCVQIYNATEIMNMTISVNDNLKYLDDQTSFIMSMQIAAGLFVFAMIIVATIVVIIFCIYVHITDRNLEKVSAPKPRKKTISQVQPSTSTALV